jgi:hypothetical protein
LPTRELDIPETEYQQANRQDLYRRVGSDEESFDLIYESSKSDSQYTVTLIETNKMRYRIVEPYHALETAWDAPFFFEDRQNVFFVTTKENPVEMKYYNEYGFWVKNGTKIGLKIPPIIFKTILPKEVGPKFWGDGQPEVPSREVIDRTMIKRFVSEDAYIHQGIDIKNSVKYGEQTIVPSGAIPKVENSKVRR